MKIGPLVTKGAQ